MFGRKKAESTVGIEPTYKYETGDLVQHPLGIEMVIVGISRMWEGPGYICSYLIASKEIRTMEITEKLLCQVEDRQ